MQGIEVQGRVQVTGPFLCLFAYSESKLTFHFVVVVLVLVVVLVRRKVEKDGNANKGPF